MVRIYFCGCATPRALDPNIYKWNKRHLTWRLGGPTPTGDNDGLVDGVTPARQHVLTQAVFDTIEEACNLTFEEVTDPAAVVDIHMNAVIIDGRGGAIAASSEVATGSDRPLQQWYEKDEGWSGALALSELQPGEFPLFLCRLHEVGHALGLDHSPDPADLMYPQLTSYNVWKPTGWFLEQLQLRYGAAMIPIFGACAELTRWYDATTKKRCLVEIAEIYHVEDRTGYSNFPGCRIHLRSSNEPPFTVSESYEAVRQLLAG